MRKIFLITIVLFLSSRCKDVADEGFGGRVSLIANGEPMELSKSVIEVAGRNLKLKSYSGNSMRLEITLCGGIAETTYHMADTSANGFLFFPSERAPNFAPHYNSTNPGGRVIGKIEITAIDEKNRTMSGSFSVRLARHWSSGMKLGDTTNYILQMVRLMPYLTKSKKPRPARCRLQKLMGWILKGQ